MEKKSPIIKNIVDTFRILDVLNETEKAGIAFLSQQLDIPKTTIFRIIKTLEEVHVIKQLPDSDYTLDYRLSAYAKSAAKDNQLVEMATPFMNQLKDSYSETVNLGILHENQVVIVQTVEGEFYQLQASLVPMSPLYCSGMGKLFLSEYSEEELKHYFVDLKKRTVNTIVDYNEFLKNVEIIKEEGISVDDEEYEYGLSCYAVPIYDKEGKMICSMSVSGPSSRLYHKGIDKLKSELKEKGKALEEALQRNY
ncbi:IclR family transcriptional regulator [Vagococcus carniphilus]|uniref:IclR family transcriptional regulator n=1 Tax=Vagococcus carniphilus TaxID=218144 RepID=UPI002891B5C5|nr:IclR family transcriptional regulator [Vagococcus carniphilus]MDT2815417.1 IclR family transcriptional regulator [Vagococcus carniphilus]